MTSTREGGTHVAEQQSAEVTRTLPDHDRCSVHRHYKLSCGQYELLISRAGHCCEICRRRHPHRKLFIDHCGPLWAVRGLLCNGCNSRLEDDKRFSQAAADYLDNAWWMQQCAAIGVPADRRDAQPPVGSSVRNQWGVVYIHTRQDSWFAPMQPGRGHASPFWGTLCSAYGPQNLAPVDLRAEMAAGTLPREVIYVMRNGTNPEWTHIRELAGLAEPEPRKKTREWSARDSLPWLATPEKTVHALRAFLTPDECHRIVELFNEGA